MTSLDLSSKRILVTGGAGFLGRQVIDQLVKAGADADKISVTRSIDCDPPRHGKLQARRRQTRYHHSPRRPRRRHLV